jgi:hypothetical protein
MSDYENNLTMQKRIDILDCLRQEYHFRLMMAVAIRICTIAILLSAILWPLLGETNSITSPFSFFTGTNVTIGLLVVIFMIYIMRRNEMAAKEIRTILSTMICSSPFSEALKYLVDSASHQQKNAKLFKKLQRITCEK